MIWNDPLYEELRRMQREMDRMFVPDQKQLANAETKQPTVSWYRTPRCDMCETEKSVLTTIELPGVDKGDIQLNITDDAIEVKVEKKQEKEQKGKGEYKYSSSVQSFYRAIPLPRYLDAGKAKAEYKNGVLTIEVPKTQKSKVKRLEIR
jgi:HSP20 family protein